MYFSFLGDEQFLQSRKENRSYFFGSIPLLVLSWAEILEELERHVVNSLSYDPKNNLRFIIYQMIHPTVIEFTENYSNLDQTTSCTAHGYINLMSKSGENGRHKDQADVIFWQVCGSTIWTVENQNETCVHTLNPGDAIYVPANIYHSVESLTPRAGISFGLENG